MVMFIHRFAHKFATDPDVQYKFNGFFTVFWLLLMFSAPAWPCFHFFTTVTDQWGTHNHIDGVVLGALLIFEVSLWANAFTHFGALGANLAAKFAREPDIISLHNNSKPDLPIATDI